MFGLDAALIAKPALALLNNIADLICTSIAGALVPKEPASI